MITTMAGFEVTYHIVTGLEYDEEKSFEKELLNIEYASAVFTGVSEGIFITFHYEIDSIDWSLAHHSFLEIEKIIKKYKKAGVTRKIKTLSSAESPMVTQVRTQSID